jgi:hypothetical protein
MSEVPVTVIVLVPGGVEAIVVIVSVEGAPAVVGVTGLGEKEHEAPDGSPDVHASVTVSVVPETKVAVIVFDPVLPGTTEIGPEFDSEKSIGGGVITVSTKVVFLSTTPVLTPVRVIVEVPGVVDEATLIVMVVVNVGVPADVAVPPVKVAVAPVGNPLIERVTVWVTPLTKVAVTSLAPLWPWTMVVSAGLDSE